MIILRQRRSARPWAGDAVARLAIANVVALCVIVAGVYQVAGAEGIRARMAWLNLGIAALVASGCANGLWLLRVRGVVGDAREGLAGWASELPIRGGLTSADEGTVVLVPGTGRYHRASCAFVAGRQIERVSVSDANGGARQACEVCLP